jgi:tRNA(adenine34) deaminase
MNKKVFSTFDCESMSRAIDLAQDAFSNNEVPVGAVITFENKIIASAYNKVEGEKSALCHAEMQCIGLASERLGRWRLEGCTLYVTLEPCLMCLGAIVNSRISNLVYGAKQTRRNKALGIEELLREAENLGPQLQVLSGLMQEESTKLLKEFFNTRRV